MTDVKGILAMFPKILTSINTISDDLVIAGVEANFWSYRNAVGAKTS